MKSVVSVLKEKLVLVLAVMAASVSMLAVPPSASYAGYINVPVLAILFCLMVVIGGLREAVSLRPCWRVSCSDWERCANWRRSWSLPVFLSVCG